MSLVPALALAAPPHKKRPVYHWHGYGFLPGYHQPPNTNVPIYGPRGAIGDGPEYVPSYWDYRGHYYFGRPGYYRGRYNGGSFRPVLDADPDRTDLELRVAALFLSKRYVPTQLSKIKHVVVPWASSRPCSSVIRALRPCRCGGHG